MSTLNIRHPVTDFDVWSSAFDRFATVRRDAGSSASGCSVPSTTRGSW